MKTPMQHEQYDVFICHASEDNETIARPLAMLLTNLGVKVWYDEFALDVGDSLSRSIDKGLATSSYGAVIISKAFISKGWTAYELSGLISKEISARKVILPIWHGISRQELLAFSPPLADKCALDTQQHSIHQIAVALLKVAKPDIYEGLQRYVAWLKLRSNAQPAYAAVRDLNKGPIRHEKLPLPILGRIKVIYHVLSDATDQSLETYVDSFRRDMHPDEELAIWERIAGAYLQLTAGKNLQKAQKREIFSTLLSFSMQSKEILEQVLETGSQEEAEALSAYLNVPSCPPTDEGSSAGA